MPILQYVCKKCNHNFEEFVKKYDQPVPCPLCGSPADRSYCGKMYTATGKVACQCGGNCSTCGGCKH